MTDRIHTGRTAVVGQCPVFEISNMFGKFHSKVGLGEAGHCGVWPWGCSYPPRYWLVSSAKVSSI